MPSVSDKPGPEDRRVFAIDDDAWTKLSAILDRSSLTIAPLAELLRQGAPWDDVP